MQMKKGAKQYGLIGERLSHSYSKRLHELLGEYSYELFPLARPELDTFLREATFDGLNVTIPYKQAVIPYCAELSETAARMGSVNTLLRRADGTLYGDNTDAFGFGEMARHAGIDFAGQKALVLGSGGTSLTACAVIKGAGGTPVVISRNGENHYENLHLHADATIVVNTTPVGMYPGTDGCPVDLRRIPRLSGVLDVVYNPLRTRLLQQAEQLHIPHAGGLYMLVMQAARACELFTGKKVPGERVQNALSALRKSATNLVVVGMPGCGKTTMGERLAALLALPLCDVDSQVEQESGTSIPALFAAEGEAGFRAREAAIIERCGREGGRVLVTGGGAVLTERNRQNLRMNGFVVHITRPLEQLPIEGRPLSKDREALEAMWRQRSALYTACADVTIANEGTPEACVQAMKEAYDEALCH